MRRNGVRSRRCHINRLHGNILYAGCLLLINRFYWKEVLVFDRCILDHVVVHASQRANKSLWADIYLLLARPIKGLFDVSIRLECPAEEIEVRRDIVGGEVYYVQRQVYKHLAQKAADASYVSRRPIIRELLEMTARLIDEKGRGSRSRSREKVIMIM